MLLQAKILCALCFGLAYAQQPSATSSITTVASGSVPLTTQVSTLTTTLTSRQSLPTSLTASASHNGSVYYLPVTTAFPAATLSTSTTPLSTANSIMPSAIASATSTPKVLTTLPLHTVIDPAFGVLGGLFILAGLPMTFYGHRNRWSSYFLTGFFASALVCISIILQVGVVPAVNPPSKGIRGLFLVAAVVSGAIGGVLSILFWRGAGLFACGLGGFFLALFLQAVRPGGLIESVGLRYVLYIGLFAAFFSVSCIQRVHSLTLALATAITGATALTLGIDCFSTQGLKEFYIRNIGFDALFTSKYPPTFQDGHFPLVQGMQIELGVLGALILMGVAFQLRLWSDLRQQLDVLRRSDHRRNMRSKAERAARAVAQTAKHDLAVWEARHGYTKTASSSSRDEENFVGTAENEKPRARSFSFMTLPRASPDATQLAESGAWDEKQLNSPASRVFTTDKDLAFPAVTASNRKSNFVDYLQNRPEKAESPGPRLQVHLAGGPLQMGFASDSTALNTPTQDFSMRDRGHDIKPGSEPMRSMFAAQGHSLDLDRAAEVPQRPISFRTRSASTAALMDNAASFLSLPKGETAVPVSSPKPSHSLNLSTPDRWTLDLGLPTTSTKIGHENTTANEVMRPKTTDFRTVSHERSQSTPMGLTYDFSGRSTETGRPLRDYLETQKDLRLTDNRISVDGFNPNVSAARKSLTMRRGAKSAVPWTNPGTEGEEMNRGTKRNSADSAPRVRTMSVEELGARHRAKLAALQKPATATVQEADVLRKAKEAWDRKQALERRRMQEKKLATTVYAKDDARRSKTLNASLLDVVGEESRQSTGLDRAAEWSKSVRGTKQLDPRAALPPIPASASGTLPASSTEDVAENNPFSVLPSSPGKMLTDTDRRRLSQGAGVRTVRRYSQPLVDFKLPGTK